MYAAGLAAQSVVPLLASLPGILLVAAFAPGTASVASEAATIVMIAPLLALSFVVAHALLIALAVRAVSPLVKAGWHRDDGTVGWVLWFSESLMDQARGMLFPLYSSLYTRPWLRLAGIQVGKRTEISTAVGLNRLTRFGEGSFATDDVVLADGEGPRRLAVRRADRGREPQLPRQRRDPRGRPPASATTASWVCSPPPRRRAATEHPGSVHRRSSSRGSPRGSIPLARPTRPARLIVARAAMELIRILLPATVSTMLAGSVFLGLAAIGTAGDCGRWCWPLP